MESLVIQPEDVDIIELVENKDIEEQRESTPSFFFDSNTKLDENLLGNITRDAVLNFGQSQAERAKTGIKSSLFFLRPYFEVSPPFVREKLLLLSFPWIAKWWCTSKENVLNTREKETDLYLPTMAWVTLSVLSCFARGYYEPYFSPIILGEYLWLNLSLWFVWTIVIWTSLVMLLPSNPGLTTITCWTGYNSIHVILTCILCLLLRQIFAQPLFLTFWVTVYMFAATIVCYLKHSRNISYPENLRYMPYAIALFQGVYFLLGLWLNLPATKTQ